MFSSDKRPKRTISTLMGWWEGMPFLPNTLEMIFDKNLSPLYGWMFPETETRCNIGICMDGEGPDGRKTERNVREVFARFLEDHFRDRLRDARQIGKLKGHPISYTTWIRDLTAPGMLHLGEAARITHNATGEGIFQAMQSGLYAADALADVLGGAQRKARLVGLRVEVPAPLHARLPRRTRRARRAQDAAARRCRRRLQLADRAARGDVGHRLGPGRLEPHGIGGLGVAAGAGRSQARFRLARARQLSGSSFPI